jgi:hypothetical protein
MSWNYRIMKHEDEETWYGIHEVFYKDGKIALWTEKPVEVLADSVEDLGEVLKMMMKDYRLSKEAVLDFNMQPEVKL